MTDPVSIRPSEFVEGGAVPVDRNLTWKEVRFNLFDYTKKDGTVVATTTAARVNYVDDDGAEFEQQYSVSDPGRFIPSVDGKTLVAIGTATALSKSSNFSILMNALVNAGFPENKLVGDVSVLDGLQTYNIGFAEPKRTGLARVAAEGEAVRERVLSIPSQILKLPWEKGKGKATASTKKVAEAEEGDEDVTEAAMKFVGSVISAGETLTRQQLAVRLFKDLAKDPNKDAIASLIFKPEFQAALLANGYTMSGEEITRG